jgi:universal stress protein F
MKTILVGVDGSPRQAEVIATAVQVADAMHGRLILLRVVTVPTELPLRAYAVHPEEVGDLLLEGARKQLEEAARTVPSAILHEAQAVLGAPWRALVDAAERAHADLIVIGSHGYTGMDHLLGTTAAKVVNHAKCSVLVTRAR